MNPTNPNQAGPENSGQFQPQTDTLGQGTSCGSRLTTSEELKAQFDAMSIEEKQKFLFSAFNVGPFIPVSINNFY
jgi:hypothetical protein